MVSVVASRANLACQLVVSKHVSANATTLIVECAIGLLVAFAFGSGTLPVPATIRQHIDKGHEAFEIT